MPLPFKPDHINLWLIEEQDGWTLIDTGFSSDITKQIWLQLFSGVMNNRPIKRVILTHHHIDHMGLTGWLCQHFQAPLLTSKAEFRLLETLSTPLDVDELDNIDSFYKPHDASDVSKLFVQFRHMATYHHLPTSSRILNHGESLTLGGKSWQVLLCSGHTSSQVILYNKALDLLISGDQILPTISSNIGLWPSARDANPMAEFLLSMQLILSTIGNPLVLPSHGLPFTGMRDRIHELVNEHQQQLEKIISICQKPTSINELIPCLFPGKLQGFATALATAETMAGVHYLLTENHLVRQVNGDGIQRFITACN